MCVCACVRVCARARAAACVLWAGKRQSETETYAGINSALTRKRTGTLKAVVIRRDSCKCFWQTLAATGLIRAVGPLLGLYVGNLRAL